MILRRLLKIRTVPGTPLRAVEAARDDPVSVRWEVPLPWLRALARELITVADQLADLADGEPEAVTAGVAVRRLRRRIESVLSLCGVALIADDGPIDFLRHEVVGDRPAPGPGLVDHIAATVRPGYYLAGELLRPQQVIGYIESGP